MMLIVHPLDEPLFRLLFDGDIDIVQFTEKRGELHRRHEGGEDLRKLVDEARAYAKKWKRAKPS